eukprot:CAMPEP_0118832336 /NCGR_PEP_ID=MMETSP1162-20130426/37313_1 /TAXON_ID=33656 /ORGANISM="Phaeocystis Sp, Strain CCMP2710" /LENGTH=87 /DNA_ID=CAMNT_0006763897 /DNA_START=85 /DNA_END=344 /DNA_ORIENTATION=+
MAAGGAAASAAVAAGGSGRSCIDATHFRKVARCCGCVTPSLCCSRSSSSRSHIQPLTSQREKAAACSSRPSRLSALSTCAVPISVSR